MTVLQPFNAAYGSTQSVTLVAATPAALNFPGTISKNFNILAIGTAGQIVYVRWTNAADTTNASAVDMPIALSPGGTNVTLTKSGDQTRLSLFSASTPTVYVTLGEGW